MRRFLNSHKHSKRHQDKSPQEKLKLTDSSPVHLLSKGLALTIVKPHYLGGHAAEPSGVKRTTLQQPFEDMKFTVQSMHRSGIYY